MPNQEHLKILEAGPDAWNKWRDENPNIRPDLSQMNFMNKNFNGFNFEKTIFNGSHLPGVNFENINLMGALFQACNLQGANFKKTSCVGASFLGARLDNTKFNGAILRSTSFKKAILQGVDLQEADLRGAILTGSSLEGALLKGSKLSGADLSTSSLSKLDLSNIDMTSAKCEMTNLSGVNLTNSTLRNANLEHATLSHSILSQTDFQGANLANSHFTKAKMKDVWFTSRQVTTDISPALTKEQVSNSIFLDQAVTVATSSVAKLSVRTLRSRRNLLVVASLLFVWTMGVRLINIVKNGVIKSTGITPEVCLIVLGVVGGFFLIQFLTLALEDYEAWKLTKTNVAIPDGKQVNIHYHREELIEFTRILRNYENKAHKRFWRLDIGLPLCLVALSIIGVWAIPPLVWWKTPQATGSIQMTSSSTRKAVKKPAAVKLLTKKLTTTESSNSTVESSPAKNK